MTLKYEFKKSCEGIAIGWRSRLKNRLAFDPLPSAELLDALEISTKPLDKVKGISDEHRQLLFEVLSAAIICIEPIIVLYNSSHSPARHESNIMHESAHIILKHPMMIFDPTSPKLPRDPKCEEEAAYLGGCLQIPHRGLLWAIQKGMSTEQIADHFGASIEMVLYRANMVGQRKNIKIAMSSLKSYANNSAVE
jgi:Zn-dependent peptidase ImmA (M78 family)